MPAPLMQLRRLVRARLGIPVNDDFMTDGVLDDHINLACQTIDAEYHWPWLEQADQVTLTVAEPDIEIPEGWSATRTVYWRDDELEQVSAADVLRFAEMAGTSPAVWSVVGGAVVVRPKVSQDTDVIHLYYVQSPWLREDSDLTLVPTQFTGAIVAKASELLAARESSGGDTTRHGAEFQDWVARMRKATRPTTGPTRVRVRPGGWL